MIGKSSSEIYKSNILLSGHIDFNSLLLLNHFHYRAVERLNFLLKGKKKQVNK